MKKLIKRIKENASRHSSIPFWSWNDRLMPDELRRQIQNMNSMHMKGFFMHARSGLETKYLSDEWYDCIKACIDEAKKLGMQAWCYDENGWPSGFAGGKLLEDEDNHAVYLDYEWLESFPCNTEDALAIYAFDSFGVPYIAKAPAKTKRYLKVSVKTDSSYVDTMRADITDKFIEATHEAYKRALGDDFGGSMPGFFTDEPQYYRWKTPYSKHMEKWFFEEYGYSVIDAIPALFCDYKGAKEHRYDYHRLTCKKFTENFSKRLYDWHEKNGVKLTGHFVQEETLAGQMMCAGDIMPQYLYEHIPGVDYLGRELIGDLAFKQLGSVAAQTGRDIAMSEMFACSGWDVSPRELRRIAELQYANGINLTCQHLYPYSIRGQRKRDYPAFYSKHNVWQNELAEFNEYFNNLGSALSIGEESADVLVIHPMHTAWLDFQRFRMDESVEECDKNLASLVSLLSGNGIGYHFGSETIMKELASVSGDVITVGKCSYHTVIISACDTLDSTTVAILEKFRDGGGKIYTYLHHLPDRIDGRAAQIPVVLGLEDISDSKAFTKLKESEDTVLSFKSGAYLRKMSRNTELGKIIFVTNLGERDESGIRLFVKGAASLASLDLISLKAAPLHCISKNNGTEVELSIPAGESILIFEYDFSEKQPALSEKRYVKLNKDFKVKELPKNILTLDRAYVSRGNDSYGELMPLERIRDELLSSRYRGQLTLAFPFSVIDIPTHLVVVAEISKNTAIKVNGKCVFMKCYDAPSSFYTGDIAPFVKEGENLIEITLDYYQRDYVYYVLYGGVSESLRNCLVFDTEIENIYLRGSFALDMKCENFTPCENNAYRYDSSCGMSLIAQRPEIDITNIVTDGYPFFAGHISFETKLIYNEGEPTLLRLCGRYSTAKIILNGCSVGNLVLSDTVDLKPFLQIGENHLEITLANNYRNALGPHHFIKAEPHFVNPTLFSFEGKWNNGVCNNFDARYSFVRFGIDV